MGDSKPICLRLCSPAHFRSNAQRQSHFVFAFQICRAEPSLKTRCSHSTSGYPRNKQIICPYLEDYTSRIERKQSTTHKQTIRAKLTGIYAMERKFLWNQSKECAGQVLVERREESPLKKDRDSSALRPSALHDALAKCFNNGINGA